MCRPISDLLGLRWQGLGRGGLRLRHQAQVQAQVSSGQWSTGPTSLGARQTDRVLSKWGMRRADA